MTDDIDALEPLCDELMQWAQDKTNEGWKQQDALAAIVIVATAICEERKATIKAEIARATQ